MCLYFVTYISTHILIQILYTIQSLIDCIFPVVVYCLTQSNVMYENTANRGEIALGTFVCLYTVYHIQSDYLSVFLIGDSHNREDQFITGPNIDKTRQDPD